MTPRREDGDFVHSFSGIVEAVLAQRSLVPMPIKDNKALVLYCRVHFYLEALPQSFDVVSALHYHLQLRQNLVSAPRHSPENLLQPVALALQAEYGDWRPGSDLPAWSQQLKVPKVLLTREYGSLQGMQQPVARMAFIRALMPHYNMHLYAMSLRTKEGKDAPVWIGVTPKGIEVYQNNVGRTEIPEQPKVTFLWANITKLYFERKKFEIRGKPCPWAGSTQKLSFTASSESVPRHLLILCRCTHQFHLSNNKMLITSELNHQMQKSSANSSANTETSCTGNSTSAKNDDKMLDLSLWADGLLLSGGESNEHQRVSVISNASSNTTSGIVSDRVYSLDGSEEDLDMREIPYSSHGTEGQSTSLESLSSKPPPPSRPHKLSKSRVCRSVSTSNGTCELRRRPVPTLPGCLSPRNHHRHHANGHSADVNHDGCDDDDEAKHWYCDSDCEDCEDEGPCRSTLVQTIAGQKESCPGHCECNCCMTEELELDALDLSSHHDHTPSMVSEGTLKAGDCGGETSSPSCNSHSALLDAEEVILDDDITHPCEKEALLGLGGKEGSEYKLDNGTKSGNGHSTTANGTCQNNGTTAVHAGRRHSSSNVLSPGSVPGRRLGQRDLVHKRESLFQSARLGVDEREEEAFQGNPVESKSRKTENDYGDEGSSKHPADAKQIHERMRNGDAEEQEHRLQDADHQAGDGGDDPVEHVYGEIYEETFNKTDDRQYFKLLTRNNNGLEGSTTGGGAAAAGVSLAAGQKKLGKQQEAMDRHAENKKIPSAVSPKSTQEFVYTNTNNSGTKTGRSNSNNSTNNNNPGRNSSDATVPLPVSMSAGRRILSAENLTSLQTSGDLCDSCCCPQCCDLLAEQVEQSATIDEPPFSGVNDSSAKIISSNKGELEPGQKSNKKLGHIITKEGNGLITPKMASLKCLKTRVGHTTTSSESTKSGSTSWLPGSVKSVGKKVALNNKKNSKHNKHQHYPHHHHHHHLHQHYNSQLQNDYVEFGEKLQQGKYPNGRTVSDNFDTDSDYVQLPPLFPRPLPKKPTSKLWRLVTKSSSNKTSSTNSCCNSISSSNKPLCCVNKQVSGPNSARMTISKSSNSLSCKSVTDLSKVVPQSGDIPPAVNLNTLPRRHKLEAPSQACCNSNTDCCSSAVPLSQPSLSPLSKLSSKSTTALHKLHAESETRPEPPPKPLKRHVSANVPKGKSSAACIDARFIATKPQILVQTAYATPAPLGIPSQAQILFRSSQATNNCNHAHNSVGNSTGGIYSSKSLGNPRNYAPFSMLQHSQSVDNIYDTVAAEEPAQQALRQGPTTVSIPCLTPPPYPTAPKPSSNVVIKSNNYIDVHASAMKHRKNAGQLPNSKPMSSRTGSVPNNLNNFLIGLQNLKPLSRSPIVQPAGNAILSMQHSNSTTGRPSAVYHSQAGNLHSAAPLPPLPQSATLNGNTLPLTSNALHLQQSATNMSASTSAVNCTGNCAQQAQNPRFTTVYTNQLTSSQIQQFKAQLYSDMDYVIFPPKDPRVSQQEYYESKSLSYTTLPTAVSNYGLNEIPPPYLPPPPPYSSATGGGTTSASAGNLSSTAMRDPSYKPPRPAKSNTAAVSVSQGQINGTPKSENGLNISANSNSTYGPTSPPSWAYNSYGSIYNVTSNQSQCSSSHYGGFYSANNGNGNGSSNLNAENLQKFLSTQSLASNVSSAQIYYPCSTQSAPPLPPYNNKTGNKIIIENEMRKAVQSHVKNAIPNSNGAVTERLNLARSDESLYDQVYAVKQETEQKLQAIFNLPPPPPYDGNKAKKVSPSELDLASLRAKCQALELPLLRALCSDGALLTQTKPKPKIRPTAHAHPKLASKQLSLPPKSKPVPAPPVIYDSNTPPPLPPHLPQKPSKA